MVECLLAMLANDFTGFESSLAELMNTLGEWRQLDTLIIYVDKL